MTSNQWKPDRTSIPKSMECSGTALIFTLRKYTQAWQRINTVQCINLDNELNYIRDCLQYTLYEVTSNINSQIRELELSASKNSKTATDMFRWTWLLFAVGFSVGLFLYLSNLLINWIFAVSYASEFLVDWTIFFSVMVVFLLVLAVFFSALAALDQRRESKLISQFDSLSQIGSSFSIFWQKSYLQQVLPSVRSN
jgi:glucan phosphoethanolaminetransferase (alkaline phosphatase superfamily)